MQFTDHYGHHKLLLGLGFTVFLAVVLTKGGLLQLGLPVTGLGLAGVFLILAGRKALLAGRSCIQGISLFGGGVALHRNWTTRELEQMGPTARRSHARLSGWIIILFGVSVIVIDAWFLKRETDARGRHRARGTHGTLASVAGTASRSGAGRAVGVAPGAC